MNINTKISAESWANIDPELSKSYLHYYSKSMKFELAEFIKTLENPKILDIGCGNAQIYPIIKAANPNLKYYGIDISQNLLNAAASVISPNDALIQGNIYDFLNHNTDKFDVSILCHMVECSESIDFLISNSINTCSYLAIIWFDYPKYEYDSVYINHNPHSGDSSEFKPYIRRKIGKDYWNMVIHKNNLELVYTRSSNDNDILEIYKTK